MTTPTLPPRERRRRDLLAARARIDAELGRMGMDLDDLPRDQPPAAIRIDRAAHYARKLVHAGHTHAEVARMLHIHPDAVAGLIAPGRVAT